MIVQIRKKRARKQVTSRNKERSNYVNPEKRAKKLVAARNDYANLEKRAGKQVAARNKERSNYVNLEKRVRKQTSSRRSYHADPEKKSAKIQNVIKNRCRQRKNITNVIETFQKRCREDQPIYACKICNRIEFRSQVIRLDPDSYDHSLLMKVMTEDIYCQLRGSDAWICKTCHDNIRKGSIPRIASVNKHYDNLSLKITLKNYSYSENRYYKRKCCTENVSVLFKCNFQRCLCLT